MKHNVELAFISSSGGHFEQLIRLYNGLSKKFESIVITEKTKYMSKNKKYIYIPQINRKSIFMLYKLFIIVVKTLFVMIKYKPKVIISTGAFCTVPCCIIAHFLKRKVIFIESFAKINSPTKTGKLIYRYADLFIVQWKEMLKIYPNAKYFGHIY